MGEILKIEKEKLNRWLLNNLNHEAIEQELINDGIPQEFVAEYIKAYKKLRIEKRQTTAFIFLVLGAFVGFLSFLFAITNMFPEFHTINLYGGTLLAGTIIFIGLYYLFE